MNASESLPADDARPLGRTFTRVGLPLTASALDLVGANRPGREVGALFRLGLICSNLANGGVTPDCPTSLGGPRAQVPYWDPQFSSLFAWSSLGTSSYNAGQLMVRHPMGHGLQVDFSYTYSKLLDLGSDPGGYWLDFGQTGEAESGNTEEMLTLKGQMAMAQGVHKHLKLKEVKPEWLADTAQPLAW
ncbi:MAG TPA: hypothetical protein VMQ17_25715 [Candidatus Sulfotelmatobacter sp.]|nr:hypothetical protein [Candidatus Sulfotelmatobacter sp.]